MAARRRKDSPKTGPGERETLTCRSCGEAFTRPHKRGMKPRHCFKCRPPDQRRRDLGRLEAAHGSDVAREVAAALGADGVTGPGATATGEHAVLAVGAQLRLASDDAVRAAALAGLDVDEAEAQRLAAQARLHYPDLVSGDPVIAARALVGSVLGAGLARVLAVAHTLPAAQAGALLRQIGAVADQVGWGSASGYTRIELVLGAPDDDEGAS